MREKSFLILGGTSFLGYQMYNFLKEKRVNVSATYYKNKGINEFFKCNLLNYTSLNSLPKYDVVMLYAAYIVGKNKFKKNEQVINNVIKYVKKNNSFLVFISSSQVKFLYDTEYKLSKIYSENLIKKKLSNFLIIRPSLPFDNRNLTSFNSTRQQPINFLIKLMKKYKFAPIIGNGKQTRQPIYVDDLNLIVYEVLNLNIKPKIIEIGGPQILSYTEIISLISDNLKIKVIKLHIPFTILLIISYFFNFIDKDNLKNAVSSEKVDNKSWQELSPSLKSLKLKKFFSKQII